MSLVEIAGQSGVGAPWGEIPGPEHIVGHIGSSERSQITLTYRTDLVV
jgi:hypothetical protein